MSKEFQSLFWPHVVRCPGCKFELERRIEIPSPFYVEGLNRSEIEHMEEDIWVCPSECGYFEYPTEPLYTFDFDFEINFGKNDEDDKPDLPRQLPLWPE